MRTGNSTMPTTGLNWLFGDHLGSTSLAANSDGSLLPNGEQRYKPWGEKRFPTGDSAIPTSFQFTGQRNESTLGLYFYNSRWFDPALGRFIQADPIVPNPLNSQSLDRYAYVINNPVRYTDQSGNCAGDPNNPKNPDYKCYKLLNKIQTLFPNVTIADSSIWTFKQLKILLTALSMVRKAFGSLRAFINALGNFTISLAPYLWGAYGMTPPGQNHIYLNYSLFEQKELVALHAIIHEIGHIFDFHNSGGDPNNYKSQFFVDLYGKGCDTGLLGCFRKGQTHYPCALNIGGACEGYNPDPKETTEYGSTTSVEDFAESFAAYVMNNAGMPYEMVNPIRLNIITNWINLFK
jgi:RHS repeat-associated protein